MVDNTKPTPEIKERPVSVYDVVKYMVTSDPFLTTNRSVWHIQKLVYLCQMWSTVWHDIQLFNEEIQAWAFGPVCPALVNSEDSQYLHDHVSFANSDNLTLDQKNTVDTILDSYGKMSIQELGDVARGTEPYKNARKGILSYIRGESVIPLEDMAYYAESLPPENEF